MADTLPCPDGAGSINNPDNGTSTGLTPYVPTDVCIGQWQISTADDLCARNETQLQESYAAENININGAPLNIYKLLGIHEQGNGSVLSAGTLMGSPSEPGFPLSNINTNPNGWHSSQVGSAVAGAAFVGVDFGYTIASHGGLPENAPPKPNWQTVGAVTVKQGNTAFNFARQIRVDIADGKTEASIVTYSGAGDGTLVTGAMGPNAAAAQVTVIANDATTFTVMIRPVVGSIVMLQATVGVPFISLYVNFTITAGTIPFVANDMFSFTIDYVWKRAGVFNTAQSATAVTLNLQSPLLAKAVRIVPSLYTGTSNWEVLELDVLDSPPTDINNVQDLFFQENRDRDYAKTPVMIKAQYSMNDSISDLSRFGLNILDQYSFIVSFPVMVSTLGRPLVTGDIIEVTPELQYDQNLKPIRKFLEVTDTGWSSQGFSTAWRPTLYRCTAQQVLPSQETRDIFGTVDTQKYLTADSILADGVGEQLDTSGLTTMEELMKQAAKAVPERGSDDGQSIDTVPTQTPAPPVNAKGQPPASLLKNPPNLYIEDGLPKNGEPYLEGYALPDTLTATDGDYFRLYYPDTVKIAPRLYRFSAIKNRWIFLETDRRIDYASAKPSINKILQSSTRQGLGKKL